LDLLEDPNNSLSERVKALALHIWKLSKPSATEPNKLMKWEEVDAQALFTILMNIVPNIQAGLAPQQRMHGMDY